MIDFPLTLNAVLTVAGMAIISCLLAQWLKQYLADWRFTNLLVLGLNLVVALLAQAIRSGWRPSSEECFLAVLLGLFGASLATFGYETILNLLGKAGIGSRAAS